MTGNKSNKYIYRTLYIFILAFLVMLTFIGTSLYYTKYHINTVDSTVLDKIYSDLESNYYKEVDEEAMYGGAAKGMTSALEDPYTSFMTPEETELFQLQLENQFVGIGVQIEQAVSGVYITKVFEDSPAEEAGLIAGDVFSTVDGEDVTSHSVDELGSIVRGPEGSEVVIGVKRAGESEDVVFEINRAAIVLEALSYGIFEKEVGYIKINDFTGDIYSQFSTAYSELQLAGISSLIIDVRDNGGGYLDQVLKIADMFVDDSKPIYQEKIRDKVTDEVYGNKTAEKIEVAMLINNYSASASELLAAALSEINGSTLIGETTYGKGTAQTTRSYSDGSTIKYTYAQWLTPDGNWINDVGVVPTIELELSEVFSFRTVLIDESLKFDQVSTQVVNAQNILNTLGYTTRVDGYYGKDTVSAVESFQKDNNLSVTGSVDGSTANVLNEKLQTYLEDYKNDNQIMKAIEVLKDE